MKIWAFPSFYPLERPGYKWGGIFAHRQYKGLIEIGAELEVVLPVTWSPVYPLSRLHPEWKKTRALGYPHKRIYDGITIYHPRISNLKPSRFVKKTYAERYIDSIVNFFKNNNIKLNPSKDIFYAQWLPDAVFVQQAAHKLGLKSAILSIGDDVVVWPNQNERTLAEFKKVMEEADLRFACADYLGREANNIMHKQLPYDVVRWGVDYKFLKPATAVEKKAYRAKYNIPENKMVVLTIGTAIVRKGWLDLFDALKVIKSKHVDFILVAVHAGPPELDLDAEADKRGLKENLINLGEVPPEKLNEIFSLADIFCLPSHWEGLANVIIEAMSCGLPVITTNVCGHPEVIKSGYNGLLINPKQPNEIIEAISQLIYDKDKKYELGNNARNFIVHEWGDFAHNSKKLLKVLQGKVLA